MSVNASILQNENVFTRGHQLGVLLGIINGKYFVYMELIVFEFLYEICVIIF